MSGFDCKFTEEPPKYLQSRCPICLLILREPFQVNCCGKSFCKACIQQINRSCPTCKEKNFESFQNKGLQNPLYGFQVFCSNQESGCNWQGELGQLDQHLNLNPDKDKLSIGCDCVNIICLFCNELYRRTKLKHHQDSQCIRRPFTCSMCDEYSSTYDDVIANHTPVCECRPVECPNSCGANNLQHQHLEEHVSTQCPLSYVDCEFSDAGCDAKVYRKDLSSHMEENMVTHMSLLARENRKLKQQLREQKDACELLDKTFKLQFEEQKNEIREQVGENAKQLEEIDRKVEKQAESFESSLFLSHVAPIDLVCSDTSKIQFYVPWLSDPFYSNVCGYKLQLVVSLNVFDCYVFECLYVESEFAVQLPCTQQITVLMEYPDSGKVRRMQCKYTVNRTNEPICIASFSKDILPRFTKDNKMLLRVVEVKTL